MIRKITEGFTPKHYLVEFLFGVVAVFGFYLIIAWSSYSPFDSAWSISSYQTEIINKAGRVGAWFIDFFFVFFGYVGHLLPFLICVAPIYFIRTKRVDSLTWTRFALRMFGFTLLMIGLTSLASLLLKHSNFHLAGGVLGASLIQALIPTLGKFGLLLLAVGFSILGFVFCSGSSLIRLLVKFYRWLTVQNEPEPPLEQNEIEEGKVKEITPHFSVYPEQEPMPLAQADTEEQENIESNAQPDEPQIRIIGLQPVQPMEESSPTFADDDISHARDLGSIQIEQPELPKVIIQDNPQPDWKKSPLDVVNDITDFAPSENLGEEGMPKVSLSPIRPLQPIEEEKTAPKETALQDEIDPISIDLGTQFAQQEAEREAQRQQQAAQMGVHLPTEEEPIEEVEEPNMVNGLRTVSIDELVNLFGDQKAKEKPTTEMPSLDLLDRRAVQTQNITPEQISETSRRIEQQLQNFKIKAAVKDVLVGPVVTRYELELQPGIKAVTVGKLDTDLARALTFKAVRVAETIPGKPYIGIETPNKERQIVPLRDVLDSEEFRNSKARLPMALGKDISGTPIVIDLAKTPHLLVAGSTGSGKSVGINTMILSLLFRVKPEEVKFIMIDPKVVELSIYNDIPHLLTEVVTDMKKAANALRWCVDEMERRYQLLSLLRVRNIEGFNERIDTFRKDGIAVPDPLWKPGDTIDSSPPILERMSYIVVIVDEFADLMMQVGKQIEELIARLTQKARAVGIHVILATQRPSVDVITGLIKSNIPSRIAFTVVQRNDSRTILDQNGAESLLGMGDMLYLGNGTTDLVRVHGAFMSDDEVARVADDWRARGKPNYISAILENTEENNGGDDDDYAIEGDDLDPLFDRAVEAVVSTGMTSTSFLQRRLKVGFNRASNIMEQLEQQGIVSEARNGKRELLARNPDY